MVSAPRSLVVAGALFFAVVASAAPQLSGRQSAGLVVDLEYAVYQGVQNATTGLNTWKGYVLSTPETGFLP